VVFERGAAAARAPAYAFSDGADLREEDVSAWLRRARALRAPGQGAAGGGGAAAASEVRCSWRACRGFPMQGGWRV